MKNSNFGGGNEPGRSVEEVLDTIGDEYARDVLALICDKAYSAQEIANHLNHSENTVYRRVNTLKEHGLVETQTKIVEDGNHYQVHEAAFDSVVVSVEEEEYDVEIYRREELPYQFASLWDDLAVR